HDAVTAQPTLTCGNREQRPDRPSVPYDARDRTQDGRQTKARMREVPVCFRIVHSDALSIGARESCSWLKRPELFPTYLSRCTKPVGVTWLGCRGFKLLTDPRCVFRQHSVVGHLARMGAESHAFKAGKHVEVQMEYSLSGGRFVELVD